MTKNIFSKSVGALFASGLIALVMAGNAAATEVALSDESGLAGDSVDVTFTFTGDGSLEALQAEAIISDPTVFSNIDDSNLCSGANAVVVSCQLNAAGDRLQMAAANGPGDPLESFTGTATFTIDGGAATGTIVDLTWDTADPDFTPTASTDGSIEVIDIPPEDISELSVTPANLAFGTVDLGNMPQQMVITAENIGGANSSLTISSAAYTGDPEFSIVNNGCDGTSLAFGETCDVEVEFDAGANGSYSGQVDFASDADNNPNDSVAVSGSADSVADLSVTPASGAINLGTGATGTTLSADGSFSNSGSADGNFSCTLTGDAEISVNPSPLAGTVPAGGSSDFGVSCAIPTGAAEGDTFSATLECSGDNGFSSTHEISCEATQFVPPENIPSLSQWGLIILSMLMLLIGGLSVRFYRA